MSLKPKGEHAYIKLHIGHIKESGLQFQKADFFLPVSTPTSNKKVVSILLEVCIPQVIQLYFPFVSSMIDLRGFSKVS